MNFTKIIFGFLLAAMLSSSIFLAFAATDTYDVKLQIPLPGKETITACTEVSDPTPTDPNNKKLVCTGLSEYIVKIYEWLVAAAAILAAMMLTWGGFQWLSAAGESKRVETGKKTIHNALIGLVLALGSYTLLAAINPDLVKFVGFDLSLIKPKQQAGLVAGILGGSLGGRLGPIPCTPVTTAASAGSVTVTPPGSPTPGNPCDGAVLLQHKTENKIQFTGADAGGCANEARDAGIWEQGITGTNATMPVPASATQNARANATFAKVDPHIIGAINAIAEQCHGLNGRPTQITALNEQCGHGAYASTNGHYGGKAVDIGNLCGDADHVCSANQKAIVQSLISMGYSVCTQDKFCGGNCDDDTTKTLAQKKNSHFHIQWN